MTVLATRHIKESEVTGGGWLNAVNQWEERTVQAISADGRILTLNSALQYDHLGARDLNNVLDFLPHVGNLTRNVVIRSENPSGTRGHMLSIHVADLDIRYVQFKDMGRTTYLPLDNTPNHIGRYPIHIHHLSGPLPTPANGYQFTLSGNAVDGGSVETTFKWGITVHGSHYGLIQDNVVYNYNGAAVATEDGSESFNVFDHNIRRTEDQRQFQLAQPVLRQRCVLRGLFFQGHRHPQCGYPGDERRHHCPGVGVRSGSQSDDRGFLSAQLEQRQCPDRWIGQRLLDDR